MNFAGIIPKLHVPSRYDFINKTTLCNSSLEIACQDLQWYGVSLSSNQMCGIYGIYDLKVIISS